MTNPNQTRILMGAIAALGLSSVCAPVAYGVTYTLTPNDGSVAQDWNSVSTWNNAGVPASAIPAAADTAAVSGAFNGVSQTVDISATTAAIANLTLGDTASTGTSTVKSDNASSLALASGASITSGGSAGAINLISAPVAIAGGFTVNGPGSTLVSANNNDLTISGKITPTVTGNKTIDNLSTKTLTIGDLDLSTTGTASVITIRAGTTALATGAGSNVVLGGTIADGGTASGLTLGARYSTNLGGSYFQINGTNTYTGATVLGVQSNVNTVYKINSDQPFGTAGGGTLTIGNNTYANTLEAIGADRTVTKNTMLINRSIVFQGSNSLTLAGTTINMSNNASTNNTSIGALAMINNNITTEGDVATIGVAGGNLYLNAANTSDLYRLRDVLGAGTTIIASNIADNSGVVPALSKMTIKQSGTGTLVLTGANTYQGGTRISNTGTVQLGNGGTTGSLETAAGLTTTSVVNGTAAGTFVVNRSDAYATNLTVNGPITLAQKGAGDLTLNSSQFHSGATTIGDGVNPSKLVVHGGTVASTATTTNASISAFLNGQLQQRTVTLGGSDTVASLGIKAGQPVWVTGNSASSLNYVDVITGANTFTVWGEVATLLAGGSTALTFGEGSGLGTSSAVTTVNAHGTLAGTGTISGAVNALSGSIIAPGSVVGQAGTLSTGALSLTGASLDFDLASTAAGVSDAISTGSAGLTFSSLNFNLSALTAGVLEMGTAYHLVSGTGVFDGNVNQITTNLLAELAGQYTPNYSLSTVEGVNYLNVTFTAVPEPSSFAALAATAAMGTALVRRRRRA